MAIYCNNCNGDIIGDGYNSVMHCEYADDDKVQFCAGDEGPVLCDYEEPDTSGGNWQDREFVHDPSHGFTTLLAYKHAVWFMPVKYAEEEAYDYDQWVWPYRQENS